MLQIWILLAILAAVHTPLPAPQTGSAQAGQARARPALTEPAREGFLFTVDGARVDLPVEPFYRDGALFIPLRAVSEALGAQVLWDREEGRALVTAPGLELQVPFGACWIEANGRCLYVPGGVPVTDGVAMVPAGALAAAFGAELEEDPEEERAGLIPSGVPIASGEAFYGEEDLFWLSRIIEAEAGGEPFVGKIAVGNVVMNRVNGEEFPDTVEAVVFDRRCGIQFSPAYSGSIYREPSPDSVRAAKIALEGQSVVEAALFFSPSYRAGKSWAGRNRQYIAEIGNHVFFA